MSKFSVLLIVAAIAISLVVTPNVFATGKGLKVYLTIDSNQPAQNGGVGTYQYGESVTKVSTHFINQGTTEITLNYHKGTVENGNFEICVAVVGAQGCGTGYDGPEKEPVYVHVNIEGQQQANAPTAQAQSQASNNENNNNNENTNALSQSQSTTIYVCKENGCIAQ